MKSLTSNSGLEKFIVKRKNSHNEIPDYLLKTIWKMVDKTYELKKRGYVSEAWVPKMWMWDSIQDAENKGIFSPGQKVLELGSGNGSVIMVWAYKGYDVTGIEIQHMLVEYSIEALSENKGLLHNPNVRIFEGSYCPKDYLEYREANPRSDTILLEEKLLRERGYTRSDCPYLFIDCLEDVYEKHKFSLKEFDIFYAYLWDAQIPSVAEIFKKYAKHDAKLFLIAEDAEEIAPLVGLKQHPKSYQVFTKA